MAEDPTHRHNGSGEGGAADEKIDDFEDVGLEEAAPPSTRPPAPTTADGQDDNDEDDVDDDDDDDGADDFIDDIDETVVDADGPVPVRVGGRTRRAPRLARLKTDPKAITYWIRRSHKYDSYRLWRAPKPRQIFDSEGKNTAPPHRPATNMDLIMDLTMVVILARLGTQFRYYVSHTAPDSRYDWEECLSTMEVALLVFFASFSILYSRWDRILGFDNFWGQRDGIFEIYWIVNIGLFCMCGFAMVTGQEKPCFFVARVFAFGALGLDVVTFLMYMYVGLYDGITTKRWNTLRTYLVRVAIVQAVPFACLTYFAYNDSASVCNEAFCAENTVQSNALYLLAAVWDVAMSCFGIGLEITIRRSSTLPCCKKYFGTNHAMHVGNYVERYNLLTILCIGECVVALTSMQVRETHIFDELWEASPIKDCGSSVLAAFENEACYDKVCNETLGVTPLLDDLVLFDFPEFEAAVNLLLWMVFFRISLFEFNELDRSRLHALRRHYWSGLLWRFFQPFITACILIVGYTMELVIAGHAPEGTMVPALLALSLGLFILLVELSKACHTTHPDTLWPWWVQLLLSAVLATLIFVGPLMFPAPIIVGASDGHHRMLEGVGGNETSSSSYYDAYGAGYVGGYAAYYSGPHTSDSSTPASVTNQNLLYYFTGVFFLSVLMKYIHRKEYAKLVCCGRRCGRKPRETLSAAHSEPASPPRTDTTLDGIEHEHVRVVEMQQSKTPAAAQEQDLPTAKRLDTSKGEYSP